MLNLKKIAITGGIASGKSTACQFFKKLGAYVVKSDAIVHELYASDPQLVKQIALKFGSETLRDGRVNRKVLGEKVFRDPKRLKELEALVHPLVFDKIEEHYETACKDGSFSSFVVELPLLFEMGWEGFYDVTIVCFAKREEALKRYKALGRSEEDYEKRMKRQLSPREKAKRATFLIENQGSLKDLKDQVEKIYKLI